MAGKAGKKKSRRRAVRDLPEVTCDFSMISRAWGKEWDTLFATESALRASLLLVEPDEDDANDEWIFERAKISNELEDIPEKQDALMAQVLRGVPEYYTLPNTPSDVDWSEVENIEKYVAELRYQELRDAVANARFSATKN